jgi:hypothetical protein
MSSITVARIADWTFAAPVSNRGNTPGLIYRL